MKAVQDFNYKVALASGLKHLQGGKLRQAEEQFRYLVSKFPQADGGYRGLARVQVELGDRAAALASLREGAAALSRANERAVAIDLLREAVTLDALDLAAHRRLAAALALAGDVAAAAAEYVRFTQAEIAAGDPERAKLEASYALETLGEIPALHDLARSVGLELRTVRRLPREAEAVAPAPEPVAEAAPPEPAVEEEEDPRLAAARAWAASRPASQEPVTEAAAPSWEVPAPEPAPAAEAIPAEPAPAADPFELEERAMGLIAAKDARAGTVAIEAARALAASGKVNAASDLMLQLVASGIAVHAAERELVAIARALGRSEIASERERLLGEAAALG